MTSRLKLLVIQKQCLKFSSKAVSPGILDYGVCREKPKLSRVKKSHNK